MDIVWIERRLIVAGADTAASSTALEIGDTAQGIRMDPGFGPLVIGAPAHDIINQRRPLNEILDAQMIADLESEVDSGAIQLDDVALRLAGHLDPRRVQQEVHLARVIFTGASRSISASQLAQSLGWSERSLHRYARSAFGYGTRMVRRVSRLQRALHFMDQGWSLTDIAHGAGYADQAHMTRDFTDLVRVSPGSLARERVPQNYSG